MIASLQIRSSVRQRGAASLIVVMVLVLVMSITFAFANRSLLFEQRIGANQMRATQALEVAEAGLEWALAQLNSQTAINDACTAAGGTETFGRRYITVNANGTLALASASRPACRLNTEAVPTCTCPTGGASATPGGNGGLFRIQFTGGFAQAGIVRVTSEGWTGDGSSTADGAARVSTVLGYVPAVSGGPSAALTARGNVTWQGAGSSVNVGNTDAYTSGITINAGGSIDSGANLTTVPGTPGSESTIGNDSKLAALTPDQMFQNTLGKTKSGFYNMPQVIKIEGGTNLEAQLSAAIAASGSSSPLIWVGPAPGETPGSFQITGNHTFGSLTKPATIVFNGSVQITGNSQFNGLLYSTATTWDNVGGGNSFVRGAAVSEGNYTANGSMDVIFDRAVLDKILKSPDGGAYVRVPGSWRDFDLN